MQKGNLYSIIDLLGLFLGFEGLQYQADHDALFVILVTDCDEDHIFGIWMDTKD